ncbi:MAG: hypothetical protein BWZ02_02977 [Lentisphaerae bacterium ADurb.BinA184]|nr:MAG: hypothetical protein BWZ02_02977 [Lentisphaerae bacterium ADurb.BinA184]
MPDTLTMLAILMAAVLGLTRPARQGETEVPHA